MQAFIYLQSPNTGCSNVCHSTQLFLCPVDWNSGYHAYTVSNFIHCAIVPARNYTFKKWRTLYDFRNGITDQWDHLIPPVFFIVFWDGFWLCSPGWLQSHTCPAQYYVCAPSHVAIDIIWFLAPPEGMDMLIILIWYVYMKAQGHIPCIHNFKTVSIVFLEDSAVTEAMFLCLNILIFCIRKFQTCPFYFLVKYLMLFFKQTDVALLWSCTIDLLLPGLRRSFSQ